MRSIERRWIILSPHLDDAALSLGGLISALASVARVEVWSLFCGATLRGPYSELAKWLHSSCGSSGSRLFWTRKLEDKRACRHLGARTRHFPWKDAPYRKALDQSFMYRTTRACALHEGEANLSGRMNGHLAKLINERDVIVSPLGIGKHVDHEITRHVAEGLGTSSLLYYPEVPYGQLYPDDFEPAIKGLCAVPYVLRRDDTTKWVTALPLYASQVGMLEHAAGPLAELVRSYAQTPLRLFRRCQGEPPDLKPYKMFT